MRLDGRRVEIRCAACGYGGLVTHLPRCCPICGGVAWREIAPRRRRAESARKAA